MAFKIGSLTGLLLLLLLAPPAYPAPGDLDTTFAGDGIANGPAGEAYAVTSQKDGKVLAAGCTFICGAGEPGDFALTRFSAAGAVDTGFGVGGTATTSLGPSDQAHALALQPDGKVVVAGCTGCDWQGASDFALARYRPDGTLDSTFGSAGKVKTDLVLGLGLGTDVAYGVAVQPDGKIVAGGFSNGDFAVTRYNADGSLDLGFGTLGTAKASFGRADLGFALALQGDGKIIVAGDADGADGRGDAAVARFLPSGALDGSFSGDGKATIDFDSTYRAVQGLALQPDGKIVVAGQTTQADPDFAVGRFTQTGAADPTFGNGGKRVTDFGSPEVARGDVAQAVAVQPDGKIVAAGYSGGGIGSAYRMNVALARYNADGTLDSSFGSGGRLISVGSGRGANDVALQADGKILVAGQAGPFAVIRYLGS